MRIVKWNPQERADSPDLTAMSYLVLGEFRRFARGALLGTNAIGNYAIDGFQVEASSPVSNLIRVRLDISGTLGFAFGAELIGARSDHGQLIGGDNSDGNTEGNAVQTFDFTGQPAATYTVQMRHTYSDAVPDNRAFWNPTANTEFIAQVNTRTLPQYELRISGAPSAEWLDLADVVWDGVGPIGTGNITDLRDFAFEGASPWTQTTKLGSGALPDFTRAADRGFPGFSKNAVYPALRSMGRQIQDLKGPDDNGEWNWWNDPYLPLDPSNTLTREHTTSLRSLRTVHYTVGDGIRTFGDFNGYALGTGLDACLTHIETEDANIDTHVIIQLMINGDGGVGNDAFQIGNYSFGNAVVEIRGGGSTSTSGAQNYYGSQIELAGTLTNPAFSVGISLVGGVIFRNLQFIDPGSDAQLVQTGINSIFQMYDCVVYASGTDAQPVLEIGRSRSATIERCSFIGNCVLLINNSGAVTWMKVRQCYFSNTKIILSGASRVAFQDCYIARTSGLEELVFATSCSSIEFNNCRLSSVDQDRDLVHFDRSVGDFSGIRFRNCEFSCFDTSPLHTAGAGTNGSLGTGWHIFMDLTGATNVDAGSGILIESCRFNGGGPGSGTPDAGGILLNEVVTPIVVNCEFREFDCKGSGSLSFSGVEVRNNATGFGQGGRIENNAFRDMLIGGATGSRVAINLLNGENHLVVGNYIDCTGKLNGVIVNSAHGSVIANNYFKNSETLAAIGSVAAEHCVIAGNTIFQCTVAMTLIGGDHLAISNNVLNGDNLTVAGTGVITGAATTDCSFTGNVVNNYNGTYNCLDLNPTSNGWTFLSNISDGIIDTNGSTGHVGYATTPSMNNVGGYL